MNHKLMNEKIKGNQAALRKYAASLTKNIEDAEDLYQDTILMILTKSHLYKEESYFKSWSATIMRNIFIDKCRKDKHKEDLIIEEKLEFNIGNRILMKADIQDSINRLKPEWRTIITMRLIDELKYDEISLKLNIGASTLRAIYFRAIRELRDDLTSRMLS